jgi:hypothetical protein
MSISKTLIAATLAVGVVGTSSAAFAGPFSPSNSPVMIRTADACDAYAKDYANWRAGNRTTRVAAGAIIGGLAGGLLFGAPVLGAGVGVVAQAAVHQPQWQAEYGNAYAACISGAALPQPWLF